MKHIATCLAAYAFASPAMAQGEWEFRLTPYVWAPAFEVTTGLPDGGSGSNSGSLLDYLSAAFLFAGEARTGRWSFFGEYNYLNLSDGLSFPERLLFDRVRLEGSFGSLAVGYAFHDTPDNRLEAFAGARIWNISTRLEGRAVEPEISKDLTDPIIGLRGETRLNDRWSLRGTVDIGGFGLEGSSKFQTEVIAAASYAFTERIGGAIGYRYLKLDLDNESPPTLDEVVFYGPFIAVDFKF